MRDVQTEMSRRCPSFTFVADSRRLHKLGQLGLFLALVLIAPTLFFILSFSFSLLSQYHVALGVRIWPECLPGCAPEYLKGHLVVRSATENVGWRTRSIFQTLHRAFALDCTCRMALALKRHADVTDFFCVSRTVFTRHHPPRLARIFRAHPVTRNHVGGVRNLVLLPSGHGDPGRCQLATHVCLRGPLHVPFSPPMVGDGDTSVLSNFRAYDAIVVLRCCGQGWGGLGFGVPLTSPHAPSIFQKRSISPVPPCARCTSQQRHFSRCELRVRTW
jgi:hypothetical protein